MVIFSYVYSIYCNFQCPIFLFLLYQVAAVIVLGILLGLAVLVAIPILVYFYIRKNREAVELQQQVEIMRGHPDAISKL